MKSVIQKHLAAFFGLLLLAPVLRASVVFSDTFDSGNGAWHKAYVGTGGNATTLTNDSGRLSFTVGSAAGGYEAIGRAFAAQMIGVGESIMLSFDYRQTSATGILRFGLYNMTGETIGADGWANTNSGQYAGYTTFIRSNGSNIARREVASFTTDWANNFPTHGVSGTVNDITTTGGGTNSAFQNHTDYHLTFRIDRVSETQTDTLLTVMEGGTERYSVAGSQTSGTHLEAFNTAVLRVQSGTALFDNVRVRVIRAPRPAGPRITITPAVAPETGFDLAWESTEGMRYQLFASESLEASFAEWNLLVADIDATPPVNTLNVQHDGPLHFYVIEEDTPPPVEEVVRFTNDQYGFQLNSFGFRYAFEDANGDPIASAHPQSGLLLGVMAGNTPTVSPVQETVVDEFENDLLRATVTSANGVQARVEIEFHESHVRFSVEPVGQPANARFTYDFRTAPMGPVYGLGDFGSHADEFNDVNAPCNGNVAARDQADLTGFVRDEITNQGSCRRFISNFAIFPRQGFAQVLFNDAKKRVGFTATENRIGVADVTDVNSLYYFTGDMERIYADYLAARVSAGYPDVKPRFDMFNVGWEAYGALGWNTFQEAVMHNIQTYLDLGFPMKWGVVGSGFWPGSRNSTSQGTTVSFGMWDSEATPRNDGLPNPRYPDPDALKQLFGDNDMKMLLGLRNHFKDPSHASYNLQNDGVFPQEVLDLDHALRNASGNRVRSSNNQFPGVPIHFIDSHNPAAMDWFVEKAALWGVDGFKEDAMIYNKVYQDGMWNPFNKRLMEEGYLMIARNTAFSPAGDLMRINDSYAGTGQNYHSDPHRIPLNMLNNAASAASNGYPDIIGGTPTGSTTSAMFREYYIRNTMLAAVSAGMSFGRGPWLLQHPEYEAIALKAARWHDRYAPYIFSAAIDSHETGYPHTMTPLHIAFPGDEETYHLISRERQQYQWMLGPSMLAAPLFGNDFETAESRDVYLPAGRWIDYESGTVYDGPVILENFPMPRARIPVFIGGKGVIVGKSEEEADALDVEVFPVTQGFSEYTYTWIDGATKSRITSNNAGWDSATLKIRDLTADEDVATEYDPVRGSFRFRLTPGHDYELTGG